jgi:prepilin-type processing-associated H-X9-DG protein
MEIILAVVGVTFAAFCVRAVVRVVNNPQRWQTHLFGLLGAAACLTVMGALFLPAVRSARPAARRSQCLNNLRQIGLALHNYHDKYDCFPPANVTDSNGRPMHSWRVLILPFLDQMPLYEKYRLDEPWDGPNNQKLADPILAVYRCPGHDDAQNKSDSMVTSYVAVVGPETAWPESRTAAIRDIKDGTSNTLLIVEIVNSGIHWMEPRDLHVVQMARTINPKAGQGISSPHTGGAQVLMADGTVRFISEQLTAETIRALLTAHAGETIGDF